MSRTLRRAAAVTGVGPALKANLPEVNNYVKLTRSNATLIYNNNVYNESRAFFASEAFFQMFSYNLINGVDSLVLKEPHTAVVSESTAKKYFGSEDPIGKTLSYNGDLDFTVTGIFADSPENTHLKADVLFSFSTYVLYNGENAENSWDWSGFWTYIELPENVDIGLIEQKIADVFEQEAGEELRGSGDWLAFNLQPIEDIHLQSNFAIEFEPNGSASIVYGLLIIAAFILVIAWLNFINLSTARAMHRAQESGIRKVIGSSRAQLMVQFLMESLVLNVIATGIALLLTSQLLPYFESLVGAPLTSNIFLDYRFWITFPLMLCLGAFLSGLYPAIIVSGFKLSQTLKGNFKATAKGQILRKSIVVFQFVISVVLIASTLTVYNQISFMRNKDLGVAIDKTIILQGPSISDSTYTSKYRAFKSELLNQSAIQSVSVSSDIPGNLTSNNASGVKKEGDPDSESVRLRIIDIDYDFVPSYKLKVLSGRNFAADRSKSLSPILMNEKAVKFLGFKNPADAIGQKISYWGNTHEIVGVLGNYHQDSPKSEFQPIVFQPLWDDSNWKMNYSIKIGSDNLTSTLAMINVTFDKFFPGNSFDYTFLDDQYRQQYHSEELFNKLFDQFSGMAIFIACLGFLGLSAYSIFQKMKEIGIRKILGASVSQIIWLVSSEFTKLIVVAVIIGVPIAWYMMDGWLSDFAFRIEMSWTTFLISAVILFGIAALTVFFQVLKAVGANPVETLKDE